jgi:hypothetical protein
MRNSPSFNMAKTPESKAETLVLEALQARGVNVAKEKPTGGLAKVLELGNPAEANRTVAERLNGVYRALASKIHEGREVHSNDLAVLEDNLSSARTVESLVSEVQKHLAQVEARA